MYINLPIPQLAYNRRIGKETQVADGKERPAAEKSQRNSPSALPNQRSWKSRKAWKRVPKCVPRQGNMDTENKERGKQ